MSDLNATTDASGATNTVDPATAASGAAPLDAAPTVDAAAGVPAPLEDAPHAETLADVAKALEPLADAAAQALPVLAASDLGALPAPPLLVRVEAAARRAFDSGATDEHNLMAWIHSHLSGAQQIVAGADKLSLTDEAKAIVAEVKALL